MSDQGELLLLGAVGREVREVFARHKLTRPQADKVLAALLANSAVLGRRQDEWPAAGKNTLDLVYGYILAAISRQQAVLADAPVGGHA